MSTILSACVVDANVVIKLFVHEDDSTLAKGFFAPFFTTPSQLVVYAPDLLYIECTNILWKYITRLGYDPIQAQQDLTDLNKMHIPTTPAHDLMNRALEIACAHGTSAYDGCYVALAERMQLPLLTADARLAGKFIGTSFQIISLQSLTN